MAASKLSEAMINALLLRERSSVLVSEMDEKNCTDMFGMVVPGMAVFKKLDRLGLILICEEEPITLPDGEEFMFTPGVEITTAGLAALADLNM